ncbi:nucleotidyl transferase AbiEii/AbiGii toxin family protein [Xanthomonas vasicola]|nr:nucleotidyl transferase AbiEii/AbiGii toxin family protein [Xanthomonas vasicola]MBV6747218.1 nucleotidyl transferase AbiEii/AbiGii toxin family protein [Xanthomonas vasicola pv. vasculorum NCPPB 890]MBV6892712.1 nucleotidyl transferase AbiEii/AbiGii toxin family protein [Xanthomonas vasicola pv. vasculorum]MDO6948363.1 nucleotidyl transferase AbiEii/AbiGii toxin family protein [Xanthomonas vasicola]MDO6960462.1 nucleotidyl transferase AbiEii/AbiGii toxin family protein [Xanthomonas vasicola
MFDRPHHQRIAKVLHTLNSDLLSEAECYFGGGTAIVLSLAEYRESFDIDFLCASNEGYRLLRNTVSQNGLGPLLKEPIKHLREVRADRYGIRTILEIDGVPVKIEMVSEARISIHGDLDPIFQVPTLSREDMYAEKLLANADRGLDKSTMSRDIIDLAMMVDHWGAIPEQAWAKATDAYGELASKAFRAASEMVCEPAYLRDCLRKMHMEEGLAARIPAALGCLSRLDEDDHDNGWEP